MLSGLERRERVLSPGDNVPCRPSREPGCGVREPLRVTRVVSRPTGGKIASCQTSFPGATGNGSACSFPWLRGLPCQPTPSRGQAGAIHGPAAPVARPPSVEAGARTAPPRPAVAIGGHRRHPPVRPCGRHLSRPGIAASPRVDPALRSTAIGRNRRQTDGSGKLPLPRSAHKRNTSIRPARMAVLGFPTGPGGSTIAAGRHLRPAILEATATLACGVEYFWAFC